jgi:hypothetical protein
LMPPLFTVAVSSSQDTGIRLARLRKQLFGQSTIAVTTTTTTVATAADGGRSGSEHRTCGCIGQKILCGSGCHVLLVLLQCSEKKKKKKNKNTSTMIKTCERNQTYETL